MQGRQACPLSDPFRTYDMRNDHFTWERVLPREQSCAEKRGYGRNAVDPSLELVWESLRALYLVGEKDNLANVSHYARGIEGIPPKVQQQAVFTRRGISTRAEQSHNMESTGKRN